MKQINTALINVERAGVLPVVFVQGIKGDGTPENLCREVLRFYLKDGTFIGEIDSLTTSNKFIGSIDRLLRENQAAV